MPFTGYRVTSNYGTRNNPFGAGRVFHAGIDLVKSHKAPIGAFAEGTVIFAGFGKAGTGLGNYGNVVLIKDKNGYGQLYAHLDSVAVKTGQKVVKGQTIGRQGATGQVTGSHLHFEVRKSVSPSYGWTSDKSKSTVDPVGYLTKFGGDLAVETAKNTGKVLQLPKTSDSWRVYPTNKAPVKGNEKGFLNPKKFGGLTYDIIGNPQKNVYTIKTSDFGTVNIYAAPSTGAKIVGKQTELKAGNKVKIRSSAKKYSRSTVSIPAKHKNKSYTIDQVGKDDVLIKELYSWVKKEDVE